MVHRGGGEVSPPYFAILTIIAARTNSTTKMMPIVQRPYLENLEYFSRILDFWMDLLAEAFAIVFDVGIYGEGFQYRVGKHPVFECEGGEIDDMRGYCHFFSRWLLMRRKYT